MDTMRDLFEALTEQRIDRRVFLRRAVALGLSLPAASALLAACSPTASPTAAPASSAATSAPAATTGPAAAATTANASDANVLDQIVEQAKKEGQVSLIEAVSKPDTVAAIAKGFRQKWNLPDSFQVNHTVKSTGETVSTVATEIKSGQVTFDVAWVVGVDLFKSAKAANALLAYQPSEWESQYQPNIDKLQFEAELPYYYPAQFYTFQPVTDRSKVSQDITSWQDILNLGPSVNGRFIVQDVRNSSSHRDFYLGLRRVLDASFFEKLKELYNPSLIVRVDEQIQKIVSGEADITTGGQGARAYQVWLQDQSLEFGIHWPKEGLTPVPAHMAILAQAPHPNAAKLLVEYLLSQEAMQFWVNQEVQWPLRNDYTIEGDVAKFMKPASEVSWISVPWAEITEDDRQQARDEFTKIFAS